MPKALVFHYVVDSIQPAPTGFETNPKDFVFLSALVTLDVNFPTNASASGGAPVHGNLPANQIPKSAVNQVIADWPTAARSGWSGNTPIPRERRQSAPGVGIDNLSFSATSDGGGPDGPALVTGVSRDSQNSSIRFSILGQAGYSYVVEYSTNLVNPLYWRSLATNTAGAEPWLFKDPNPVMDPARFYRVRTQ